MATIAEVDSDEEEVFWGPITVKELKASIRVAEQLTHRPVIERSANTKPKEGNEKPIAAIDLHEKEKESEIRSTFSKDNNSNLDSCSTMNTMLAESAPTPISEKSEENFADSVTKTRLRNDAITPNRILEKAASKENGVSFENSVTSQNSFTSSCTSMNSSLMVTTESPVQETVSDSFERVDPKKYTLKNETSNRSLSETKSPSKNALIMEISKLLDSPSNDNMNILNNENSLNEANKATNWLTCVPKIDPIKKEDPPKNSPNKPKIGEMNATDHALLNYPSNGEEEKPTCDSNSKLTTMEVDINGAKKELFDTTDRIKKSPGAESFESFPHNAAIPKEEETPYSDHGRSSQSVSIKQSEALNKVKTDLKNLTLDQNLTSPPAFNFSQLTDTNLSCVSPPNLTVFDDTIAPVSQGNSGFCSGPDKRENITGKIGSELSKVTSKFERRNKPPKYFSNLTAPKSSAKLSNVSVNLKGPENSVSSPMCTGIKESENRNVLDIRKSNSNTNVPSAKSSVSTPNNKGVKELGIKTKAPDSSKSKIGSLLRSNALLKTPRDQETPSNRPALTSQRKKKFFTTPPTVSKSTSALKLKFTPANTFHPCPKSAGDDARIETGSAEKFSPSNTSCAGPDKNKSSLRPIRFGIPQLNGKSGLPAKSSTFKSNLPPPKVSSLSRSNSHSILSSNLSRVKTATTPAQNSTKCANGVTQNGGSSSSSRYFEKPTFNYKGATTPLPMSINDSTSSISNASFNSCSSADSSRSFIDTVPKTKSIPNAKSQSESRLPRLNVPSGIPRVNHSGSIYRSKAL